MTANAIMDTDIMIRPYRHQDASDIITMLLQSEPWLTLGYSEADWSRVFRSDGLLTGRDGWVLDVAGRCAGIAVIRGNFLLGDYLELFAVAKDLRGAGAGRRLLDSVSAQILSRSKNLFVCVSDFNLGARAFYSRCGFVEVGPMPDLLVKGKAEILMRKTAGPARNTTPP